MRKPEFTEWHSASLSATSAAGDGSAIIDASGTGKVNLETLIPGPTATGPVLALTAPISFWGGVDPKTSVIVDVRHPQHGTPISGTILYLPGTIGSSSASAVLLELIHRGIAPAAIILRQPDAILLLGVLVAREMGWPIPAAYKLA